MRDGEPPSVEKGLDSPVARFAIDEGFVIVLGVEVRLGFAPLGVTYTKKAIEQMLPRRRVQSGGVCHHAVEVEKHRAKGVRVDGCPRHGVSVVPVIFGGRPDRLDIPQADDVSGGPNPARFGTGNKIFGT